MVLGSNVADTFHASMQRAKLSMTASYRHARSRWDRRLKCRFSAWMGGCVHEVVAPCSIARTGTRLLERRRPCRAAEQAKPAFPLARVGLTEHPEQMGQAEQTGQMERQGHREHQEQENQDWSE